MVGRGGGDRTIKVIAGTQVIDFTYRSNRRKRQKHMSEVHGGDTGVAACRYVDQNLTSVSRATIYGQFFSDCVADCVAGVK